MVGKSAPLPRDMQVLPDLLFYKRYRAIYLRRRVPKSKRSSPLVAGRRPKPKSWSMWFKYYHKPIRARQAMMDKPKSWSMVFYLRETG